MGKLAPWAFATVILVELEQGSYQMMMCPFCQNH